MTPKTTREHIISLHGHVTGLKKDIASIKTNHLRHMHDNIDKLGGKIRIQLLGKINKCGVVSPRFAVAKSDYSLWERRFLPAVGIGILVVSTSKGIMTHTDAEKLNEGGRLLGYVYWSQFLN